MRKADDPIVFFEQQSALAKLGDDILGIIAARLFEAMNELGHPRRR
jgi:hypothetical protein